MTMDLTKREAQELLWLLKDAKALFQREAAEYYDQDNGLDAMVYREYVDDANWAKYFIHMVKNCK